MPSDVVNILRYTNQRPSVEHVKALKSAQKSCQADIAGIDRNMRVLQIKMNQLLLQLKSLNSNKLKTQAESNLYTALVSPIRLLPSDVLVRVFEYCLPEFPGPRTTEAPLLLCWVCSLWRSVAFEASQLWNVLYIYDGWRTSSAINLLPRWFNSAGNRPLDFHYHDRSYSSSPQCELDNLVPYSNQIKRLSYDGPTLAPLTLFLSLPDSRVELLETVSLVSSLRRGDSTSVMITAFESAPRLRQVFLAVEPENFRSPSAFTLPWGQLTDLNITSILRWPEWCRIFSACNSLKIAKFFIDFHPDDDITPIKAATFPI